MVAHHKRVSAYWRLKISVLGLELTAVSGATLYQEGDGSAMGGLRVAPAEESQK